MNGHILEQPNSKSTDSTINCMSKHFNFFFREQFIQMNENHLKYPTDLTFNTIQPVHVTDDLVGHFITYLIDAKPLKGKKETIAYQTIAAYASSFKNTLQKRFSSESVLPRPISNEQFGTYTIVMRNKKILLANLTNTPVFGSYEAATDEDIMALSAITYWSDDPNDSEFLLMMLTMITCCGRGSEVRISYDAKFILNSIL